MSTAREHSGRGRKLKSARASASRPSGRKAPSRRKVGKKAMVASRARIVETKSRIQSDLGGTAPLIDWCKDFTPIDGVFKILPLHAYTFQRQGLGEDQMIGQSLFSKYLNAKVQIRFAGGADQITDRPYPMELICGWIQAPTNFTSFTTPVITSVQPVDLTAWIVERVNEYFNARTDKLDFIPKRDSTIRITYRRKIKSNQNRSNVMNPNSNSISNEGFVPDVMLYPKWKTKKKVFYEKGGIIPQQSSDRQLFPNYSQIPFMILYSPNYAGEDGTKPIQPQECPRVSYNVAHYFTDS